ncbi:hypothetical protein RTP6_001755 [Batrachochytrium dendrobatidis]
MLAPARRRHLAVRTSTCIQSLLSPKLYFPGLGLRTASALTGTTASKHLLSSTCIHTTTAMTALITPRPSLHQTGNATSPPSVSTSLIPTTATTNTACTVSHQVSQLLLSQQESPTLLESHPTSSGSQSFLSLSSTSKHAPQQSRPHKPTVATTFSSIYQPVLQFIVPTTSLIGFFHRSDFHQLPNTSACTSGLPTSTGVSKRLLTGQVLSGSITALDAVTVSSSISRPYQLKSSLGSAYTIQSIKAPEYSTLVATAPVEISLPKIDSTRSRKSSIFDEFEKSATQLKKSFQFSLAATGKAKGSDAIIKNSVRGSSEYASIQVGEDAYFMRYDSIGVADGVGGWNEVPGANPALYSLKMMHYTHAEFEKYDDVSIVDDSIADYAAVSPKDILTRAYKQVNDDALRENILGSTTALIAVLRENELRVANVGDCGIMIVRAHHAIFRNEEQQHSFNFPYQLGTVSKDGPGDAQVFSIPVQEGDIVVIGSDGIFDNVFDDEIVEILGGHTHASRPELSDPQRMTDAILYRAREVAENTRFGSSPFQTRAIQEGFYYQGGKMDDMTVVVGIVRTSEDSPDRR